MLSVLGSHLILLTHNLQIRSTHRMSQDLVSASLDAAFRNVSYFSTEMGKLYIYSKSRVRVYGSFFQ